MSSHFCGIDFGTSNSSVSVASKQTAPRQVEVENQKVTIPSAIFYEEGSAHPLFGQQAVNAYIQGREGRFMRSLKRVLGTELMSAGTIVNGKSSSFENILTQYVKNLKDKAELAVGTEISAVVMGRPVHFRDNDAAGDKEAQIQLQNIARAAGFKDVLFQYEPIAAAFAHETEQEHEKLACVVDIGGGTSDFSIIRIGGNHRNQTDRSSDILASSGVRIGGNDFDKNLCIDAFMPELGMKTTYGSKNLPVPTSQYFDLAEWSKVNSVYSYANLRIVKQVLTEAHNPNKYARLLELLQKERGHSLLNCVEEAKIQLTGNDNYQINLNFLKDNPAIKSSRKGFEKSISENVCKIQTAVNECLKMAGVAAAAVELVILTGGSTEIPYVSNELCRRFNNAGLSANDKLSSVGLGLAYDALRRFA